MHYWKLVSLLVRLLLNNLNYRYEMVSDPVLTSACASCANGLRYMFPYSLLLPLFNTFYHMNKNLLFV